MAKVSWKFSKENAEVTGGFSTYTGDVPPKGLYRFRVKQLKLKMSGAATEPKVKESNPMVNALLEIEEPAKVNGKPNPKAKYSGYSIWWNGNVTDQGAGFLNGFLDAAGYDKKKFWAGDVIHDGDGEPKPRAKVHPSYTVGTITKIGGKTVGADEKGPLILIMIVRDKPYQGEERMKPASFLSAKKAGEVSTEPEDDEEYEEEEESEVEESEDEEFDARIAELEGMTLAKLKATAKANGAKLADYRNMDEEDLIEMIIEQEFPPEADEEEEPEEEESEEEEPEEDEEPEEEEEPEPEPEKPARRTRAKTAAPAAKKAPARRAAPAAATRKPAARRTRSGEPPF